MSDSLKHLMRLGLEPGATPEQIREAYRDLVKVWHPDRFEHDPRLRQKAEEQLKEINQAFESLRNYKPTTNAGAQTGRSQERASRSASEAGDVGANPTQPGSEPPASAPTSARGERPTFQGWAWLVIPALVLLFIFARSHDSRPTRPQPVDFSLPRLAPDRRVPEISATLPVPLPTRGMDSRDTTIPRQGPAEAPTSGLPGAGLSRNQSAARAATKPSLGRTPAAEARARPLPNRGPRPPADANRFTVGSSRDDVLRIQGTPDRFTSDSLHYGTSDVFFRDNRVIGWYNGYPRLKVVLAPSNPTAGLSHFTIGSTWDEVLAVQGTPDRFTEQSLHYGTSDVHFRSGRVVNWYNGYPRLKVRIEPREPARRDYFTVGSTIDEVLGVQGTPDRMSTNALHYGTSDVFFENDRVVSWYNGYPRLKVRLEPGQ